MTSGMQSLQYQGSAGRWEYGTHIAINKVMKVAISHWQGRISPVFDVASEVFLVDIEDGQANGGQIVQLGQCNPFARVREIAALGAQSVICGAISLDLNTMLTDAGIHVFGFCCGSVEDVLEALQTGTFGQEHFRMPGSKSIADRRI